MSHYFSFPTWSLHPWAAGLQHGEVLGYVVHRDHEGHRWVLEAPALKKYPWPDHFGAPQLWRQSQEGEDATRLLFMPLSKPAGITANSDLLNLCNPAQYHASPLRALLHEMLFRRAVSDWFFFTPYFFFPRMNVLEEKHIIPNAIKSFGRGLWCFGITPSYSRMRSVTRGVNRKQLFLLLWETSTSTTNNRTTGVAPTGAFFHPWDLRPATELWLSNLEV